MRLPVAVLVLAAAASGAAAGDAVRKRRPLPFEYGRVVLNDHSEPAGLAPVVFEHWLHRAKFTCRVCHVDVGFAMKTGATGIRSADNAKGFYCGACHNGALVVEGRKVFASCERPRPRESREACLRCHSLGKDVKPAVEFEALTRSLPRERFGNGVDWEKAENAGLIHPADFLPGVSIARKPLANVRDFALAPDLLGMPDIQFSHAKHTVWNGCELCHPEIFVGVKKGITRYSMVDNFQGGFCGACHATVAFPMTDCQRCHTGPVPQGAGHGASLP